MFNILTILRVFSLAGQRAFEMTVKASTLRHVPCVTSQFRMAPGAATSKDPSSQLVSGSDSASEVLAASERGWSNRFTRMRAPDWRERGHTLVELTVALSILAILMRIAVPLWKATSMNIVTARRIVVANLRLARANAITKSIHYQVSFASDQGSVKLSPMVQPTPPATTWTADTTKVQSSAFPKSTQVSTSSVVIEFNTRGMVANSSTVTVISVTDSLGRTKSLQVWPSGQIHEL